MKRIATLLLCAVLAAALLLPAAAAAPDGVGGVQALDEAWQWYEAVPDYSSGYWLGEDGVLTVGLVDESGKDGVLAIVGDAPVNFVMQKYSYNELMAVQKELESYFAKDVGLVTMGVDVMENRVHADVNTANSAAAPFMEKMTAVYGDKIFFRGEDGLEVVLDSVGTAPQDGPILTGTVVPSTGAEEKPGKAAPVTIIGVILIAAAALLLTRNRRKQEDSGKK